jgi:hypothetical protein
LLEINQRMFSKALCTNSETCLEVQVSDIETDDKETDELEGAADEKPHTFAVYTLRHQKRNETTCERGKDNGKHRKQCRTRVEMMRGSELPKGEIQCKNCGRTNVERPDTRRSYW